MHILQPKHTKIKKEEAEKILDELNISRTQLPKITSEDPALPEGCEVGDVIKIERKFGEKTTFYYRVVV
jgi:DNA-directed RNA polymerase subunit H